MYQVRREIGPKCSNMYFERHLLTRFSRYTAVLRAPDKRAANEDSSKIFFLFLNKTIYCDPSSEPSRRDGRLGETVLIMGYQICLYLRTMANYP